MTVTARSLPRAAGAGDARAAWRRTTIAAAALLAIAISAIGACSPAKPPVIPGTTTVVVQSVAIVPRAGEQLAVDYAALYARLGVRAEGDDRRFNAFRLAEDGRRIRAFLQDAGYFDAAVDAPALAHAADGAQVAIAWPVHEGAAYTVGSVEIVGAPAAYQRTLAAMIPFRAGDRIDLPTYRVVRTAMANRLRADGYGRATAYSRTFLDRGARTVAWFYYVEPGPQTRIGAVAVNGHRRLPAAAIAARAGLAPGGRYSTVEKQRAELALLDSGAFASASVLSEADDPGPPQLPDRGGVLAADQVDGDGRFVPRTLAETLAVRVEVVEAPARQLRAELGVEADPSRVDTYAGARVVLRDLFAPFQHLVLAGNLGHGWFVDDDDRVQGLYGSALVQYLRPGFLARDLELRVTGRWRDTLRPSALLRELTVGPGLRATLGPGAFVEGELRYRDGRTLALPALDPASAMDLGLPTEADSHGPELVAGLVVDRRDDRVEPTAGWLLSTSAALAPGGLGSGHRWLQTIVEGRRFVPLAPGWSLAGRARAGAVTLGGDRGIPLSARLFGGGVDGMRGFARDRLSPAACAAMATTCDVRVGGRSLVEASLELRYLPVYKLYGAAVFVDAGAAGGRLNPFASGVSAAVGFGLRLRSWYLPIAIDVAYRVVDEDQLGADWDRLLGFVHIGEAF